MAIMLDPGDGELKLTMIVRGGEEASLQSFASNKKLYFPSLYSARAGTRRRVRNPEFFDVTPVSGLMTAVF